MKKIFFFLLFFVIFCNYGFTKESETIETPTGSFEIYIGPSFRIYDIGTITGSTKGDLKVPVLETTYYPWNHTLAGVEFGMVGKVFFKPSFYGFLDGGMIADGLYGGYFHLGLGYQYDTPVVAIFIDAGIGMYFQTYDFDNYWNGFSNVTEGYLSISPRFGLAFKFGKRSAFVISTKYIWNPVSFLTDDQLVYSHNGNTKDGAKPLGKADFATLDFNFTTRF